MRETIGSNLGPDKELNSALENIFHANNNKSVLRNSEKGDNLKGIDKDDIDNLEDIDNWEGIKDGSGQPRSRPLMMNSSTSLKAGIRIGSRIGSGIGSVYSGSSVKRNVNYLHPETELSSRGSVSSFSTVTIGRIALRKRICSVQIFPSCKH